MADIASEAERLRDLTAYKVRRGSIWGGYDRKVLVINEINRFQSQITSERLVIFLKKASFAYRIRSKKNHNPVRTDVYKLAEIAFEIVQFRQRKVTIKTSKRRCRISTIQGPIDPKLLKSSNRIKEFYHTGQGNQNKKGCTLADRYRRYQASNGGGSINFELTRRIGVSTRKAKSIKNKKRVNKKVQSGKGKNRRKFEGDRKSRQDCVQRQGTNRQEVNDTNVSCWEVIEYTVQKDENQGERVKVGYNTEIVVITKYQPERELSKYETERRLGETSYTKSQKQTNENCQRKANKTIQKYLKQLKCNKEISTAKKDNKSTGERSKERNNVTRKKFGQNRSGHKYAIRRRSCERKKVHKEKKEKGKIEQGIKSRGNTESNFTWRHINKRKSGVARIQIQPIGAVKTSNQRNIKEKVKMGGKGSGRSPAAAKSARSNTIKNFTSKINAFANGGAKQVAHIPSLEPAPNKSKAPVEKSIHTPSGKTQEDVSTTTYKTQILYRSKVENSDVDVVKKLRCVMARLFQYNKSVQLLPFDAKESANPLTTAKDIPSDPDELAIYMPHAFVNPRSNVLRMSFRISADCQLWKLKMTSQIRGYLDQFKIYLDPTYLSTFDNVKVGGLILSHPQYTRRDIATKHMNYRINENEEITTPIQLSPHVMWNESGDKISTRVLAVECSKEHVQMVKHRLFSKFLNIPEDLVFSNTRYFKFLPFTASGGISDKVIRAGIYLQNKFLTQTIAITVVNIKDTEWIVPETKDSFTAVVLSAEVPNTKEKIFTSIEIGVLNNKAHLLTTKQHLDTAILWTDTFTSKMEASVKEEKSWKDLTGFPHPPERLNKPIDSNANIAYANFLGQTFNTVVNEVDMENTGIKVAPSKSYARVVYGKQGSDNSTASTQSTAISSMANSAAPETDKNIKQVVEEAKKDMLKTQSQMEGKIKDKLLEEMRALNEEHSKRTTVMEASAERFESIIQELHANNVAKAKEMSQYQKRLEQIDENTIATAMKVDQMNSSINSKVDNLQLTMKTFIKVMTEMTDPDQDGFKNAKVHQNLSMLTQLMDNEERNDEDMDWDSDGEVDKQDNNVELSPGASSTLSGESKE